MIKEKYNTELTPEQIFILKQEGTETPGSSVLNNEKREGSYHCVGCGTKLFESKIDHNSGYARTEYHCKKCGGHHGHIFDDGPKPTGKRYCNNGVCLVFKPMQD